MVVSQLSLMSSCSCRISRIISRVHVWSQALSSSSQTSWKRYCVALPLPLPLVGFLRLPLGPWVLSPLHQPRCLVQRWEYLPIHRPQLVHRGWEYPTGSRMHVHLRCSYCSFMKGCCSFWLTAACNFCVLSSQGPRHYLGHVRRRDDLLAQTFQP